MSYKEIIIDWMLSIFQLIFFEIIIYKIWIDIEIDIKIII